jgi:hypothetical protein
MKRLLLAVLLFLAPIAAALAGEPRVYTDSASTQLRIYDEPCDVADAPAVLMMNGAPQVVAETMKRAKITHTGKEYAACWTLHESGTVIAVSPDIGMGLIPVPMQLFETESKAKPGV